MDTRGAGSFNRKFKTMSAGTLFLGLVWAAFIIFGAVDTYSDIWPFGVLLAVITVVLAIRNYRLKKK